MSADTIRRQHRFTVTPEHLILDPRVGDRAFRLWCRLDRFAGDKESSFPSRETLAIELDTSKASIDRAIKELCESGWLMKDRRSAGDSNVYTLTVAPEKITAKFVEAERKRRVEAASPRREKERERRREKERRERQQHNRTASVNAPENHENAQVSPTPLVTGEERGEGPPLVTGEERGVVTHDERGVVTGDETPLVTGDEEKEATPEGSNIEGGSDSSLRSESAAGTLPGTSADEKPETTTQRAHKIVHAFIDWLEKQTQAPVMNKQRTFHALVKSYVVPALEAGYAEETVRFALSDLQDAMPPQNRWREAVAQRHAGRPPGGRGKRRAYSSEETWGKFDPAKVNTAEQDAAEAAALFGPPRTGTNG